MCNWPMGFKGQKCVRLQGVRRRQPEVRWAQFMLEYDIHSLS